MSFVWDASRLGSPAADVRLLQLLDADGARFGYLTIPPLRLAPLRLAFIVPAHGRLER